MMRKSKSKPNCNDVTFNTKETFTKEKQEENNEKKTNVNGVTSLNPANRARHVSVINP
jgi:hypothetical protein